MGMIVRFFCLCKDITIVTSGTFDFLEQIVSLASVMLYEMFIMRNLQSTSANSNHQGNKNLFELVNVRINERILQKYLIKRNENMIRISESLNYRGLELTDVDCTSPVPLRITSLAMIEILPSCLS